MATRLKTVEYWFPVIATLADASAASASTITIYLPETGTKTFRSCVVDVVVADIYTTATNVTQRRIEFQLGSAGYSDSNNTQTLTQSGENFTFQFSADVTSYFTTNWSGTSMTADCRLTINTSSLGCRNASIRLTITYEFDDTSTTQVKTVWIPLNAPVNALDTTKPGSANDTIPALDTYCPEASKTFRQMTVVVQGNTEGGGAVDKSISLQVDTDTAYTSGLYELGSTVDVWYRVNHDCSGITTSATHDFFVWGSTADFDHPHAWLVVTYEFNASTTTSILNSLILPMEFDSPMGGPTSSDYQRGERELWIQEPATITTARIAYYMHFDKLGAQSGLNARVGTGSFLTYTDVAAVLAGGCGLMIRNDAAFTLARGRNVLQADVYNTDATDLGYNVSGFWLVNYTSGVPSNGIWAANHTVKWNIKTVGTVAASVQSIVSATAPIIPETSYFLTSVGTNYIYTTNSTANASGVHIGVERLSGEGGLIWDAVYQDIGGSDPEVGVRQCYATARSVFKRWVGDVGAGRLDLETSRRWRVASALSAATHDHVDLMLTYHSITFTVSGDVSASGGGTVELNLCREATGERILSTSRVGNGSYSFTWYDNTEDLFVEAYESASLIGRSANGVAT